MAVRLYRHFWLQKHPNGLPAAGTVGIIRYDVHLVTLQTFFVGLGTAYRFGKLHNLQAEYPHLRHQTDYIDFQFCQSDKAFGYCKLHKGGVDIFLQYDIYKKQNFED